MHMSSIAAGLWRLHEWGLDVPARVRWIEQALELGISTFDHADIYGGYGNETLFGEALAAVPGLRDRMQIVSKCGIRLVDAARPAHRINHYDSSRAHIVASVHASLRALRTDRLDLLLLHRPDMLVQPDEVAEAFAQLRAAGQVLAFGVSNHSPRQFDMLHRRTPLVTNQIEFSPLQMQALADGTLEQALDLGLRPMAWSPLGGGGLFSGDSAQARRVRQALEAIGAQHGVSATTAAFAWVLRHPSRPVAVAGTQQVARLREAAAATRVQLTREEWTSVWCASMGQEVP